VYILADDLGYGDVGYLNPASKIATPNIDRLAAEGMNFKDAHSGSSVCTPTRYGILTGRYAWRSPLKRGVLLGYSPPLIEASRPTVASFLKQHGYATACIGKWHLGMTWPTRGNEPPAPGPAGEYPEAAIDFRQPIKDGPCARGFDSFFGISASLDMTPYVFIENDHVVAQPTARQPKAGFVRAGAKDPAFRFEDVLPRFTDRAVDYINERAGRRGSPFFLYLALNAPHTPIAPAPQFRGKSQAGDYGDYVVEVDWAVGRVLKAIDDNTLADNTLVILTSDNGPERIAYPRIQEYHHYSMDGLRGVKRDAWEGGHRVPFLARWRGKVRPGSVCDQTICHTDLMATLAAILGVTLPEGAGPDSFSLLPALLEQKRDRPIREATVHHTASGRFAIRQGPWVLIDHATGDDNREPDWFKKERGYQPHDQPGELYNLSQDPAEHHNLYASRPEVVKGLKQLLEKYKAEGRSVPRQP
jgi:arylsulfatase A-like enzyme